MLGETSLERKCRFLFGACLLVLITGSFWWYGSRTEVLVYANTRNTGRALVNPILVQVHWWNDEENKQRDVGKMFESMVKRWQTERFEFQVLNLNSDKPDRQPLDQIDRAIYEKFLRLEPYQPTGKKPHDGNVLQIDDSHEDLYEERRDDKLEKYSYYQPIFATDQACVNCHRNYGKSGLALTGAPGTRPMETGDLLGVVKVVLPDADTQGAINKNRAFLLATAIITVFMAMIAAYVIVRYVIVKPLKHLRDVSEDVSRGDFNARADIQTADEFEDLAKAFNKMLRHLVNSQEELKQANNNLDGKVDELAQLNMRLYEMNRLKSDFLATMSHELRTPLNSIIGFSDVLSSIKSLDDKQHRYVGNIQKSGRMLLDMINDILDLAKIESGKMEIKPVEFQIENAVSAQCDMAKPLAERKNIDLLCEVEDDVRPMFQDMGKIQQILNNLLSNAIKFTPEGGRIVVAAKEDAETGDLLLGVTDNGVGIAVEDQTAIFEKFRQGGQVLARGDAMTREYSGTGLGLSIVKEICKLLGGEITLKSELGQGSTFTVRLPWVLGDGELNAGLATKPSFKALT
ncbi:MAG: ATP-binding protein [Pirellulales bacterium]